MSDQKKQVEQNELIAIRVPPGDKWRLVDDEKNIIHPSLMDVLESYFSDTKFMGDFRFSPRDGKLYAIKIREEVVMPKPTRKYNIYGDPESIDTRS
jgi:hypothetical protein